MTRTMYSVLTVLLALAGALAGPSAWAQETVFCMRDGQQIRAQRFESREGNFFLFLPNSKEPLVYSASAVFGINVPCAGPAPTGVTTAPGVADDPNAFGIHGSNTIGERLMPMLIEAYSEQMLVTKPVVKLLAAEEQEMTLATGPGRPAVKVQLHAHGSGTSAKSLGSRAAQIGMSSRRITEEEVKLVEAAGGPNLRAEGNEHVLALDGLAVVVNPANPVRELSINQIAQVFSGEVKNWKQVGGGDAAIVLHRRDGKSGTYDTFNSLVLAPRKLKIAADAIAHESSETLSEEVLRNRNAIGFIGLPYINRNAPLKITDTCGLSSNPSQFLIKTETYPLSRRLYLYSLGEPRHAVAKDFLAFALSPNAQPIVKEAGFIDQSFELQPEADQKQWMEQLTANPAQFLPAGSEVPAAARAKFAKTLARSRRTSLVFRFERGSTRLDARARQDVVNFAAFLKSPAVQGLRFSLAGFADAEGGWAANERLSQQRATSIALALRAAGAKVPNDRVLGFSYLAPTACNDSEAGRTHNRRVEVWLTN